MHTKEPYVSAKEPYRSAKEPYIDTKGPYISTQIETVAEGGRHGHLMSLAYAHRRAMCVRKRALYRHQRALYVHTNRDRSRGREEWSADALRQYTCPIAPLPTRVAPAVAPVCVCVYVCGCVCVCVCEGERERERYSRKKCDRERDCVFVQKRVSERKKKPERLR